MKRQGGYIWQGLGKRGMKRFDVDLHIHSCLSPCAEMDMSPKRIVERAAEKGLDIIAISDHNSAENTGTAVRLGRMKGIVVFPGMEVNTREEVHLLAVFEHVYQALAMQEEIYRKLEGENDPRVFGEQVVANIHDEVEGFNERLLIGAVDMGVEEVVDKVHELGGLCMASHVDRPSYSLISQLGFIPPGLDLDGIEISTPDARRFVLNYVGEGPPLVCFSDSHRLEQIGSRFSTFILERPVFTELIRAFRKEGERRIEF